MSILSITKDCLNLSVADFQQMWLDCTSKMAVKVHSRDKVVLLIRLALSLSHTEILIAII